MQTRLKPILLYKISNIASGSKNIVCVSVLLKSYNSYLKKNVELLQINPFSEEPSHTNKGGL